MKNKMTKGLLGLVLLTCYPFALAGQYEQAVTLFKDGRYTQAFKLIEPLAKQGDARAQYYLGMMYGIGHGAKMDGDKAEFWLSKAVRQGNKEAKELLAVYQTGKVYRAREEHLGQYLGPAQEAFKAGRPAQGIKLLEKGLEFYRKKLGDQHHMVGNSHIRIGIQLQKMDKPNEALAHFSKAKAIFSEVFGADHARMAYIYYALSKSQAALKQKKKALANANKAVQISDKARGPLHKASIRYRQYLAKLKTGS